VIPRRPKRMTADRRKKCQPRPHGGGSSATRPAGSSAARIARTTMPAGGAQQEFPCDPLRCRAIATGLGPIEGGGSSRRRNGRSAGPPRQLGMPSATASSSRSTRQDRDVDQEDPRQPKTLVMAPPMIGPTARAIPRLASDGEGARARLAGALGGDDRQRCREQERTARPWTPHARFREGSRGDAACGRGAREHHQTDQHRLSSAVQVG
jgi:hypothetical protein